MTWTQPICGGCRFLRYAHLPPHQLVYADHSRICCSCGEATTAGVYIRIDPASVPYPSED